MTQTTERRLKYPWIRDLEPGQEHLIEGADHRTPEFKAAQAFAWRRGWRLRTHRTTDGLVVTRTA